MNNCTCNAGYYQFYRTRAKGGLESYVMDRQARTWKLHVFTQEGGLMLEMLKTSLVNISCNDIFLEQLVVYEGLLDMSSFPCSSQLTLSYLVNGAFSAIESTTYFQCIACPSGTYSSSTEQDECIPCIEGTYQSQTASTSCEPCPSGTINIIPGSSSCIPCPSGSYQFNNECLPCWKGYYSVTTGQTQCDPCINNTWAGIGQTTCTDCPFNSYNDNGQTDLDGCACMAGMFLNSTSIECQMCQPGEWSLSNSTTCGKCASGMYSNITGATECLNCPIGSYSNTLGQTHCDSCNLGEIMALSNIGCIKCPLTFYCLPDGRMYECPLGTYTNSSGLYRADQCIPCLTNYFCVDHTTMELCPLHTHSYPGAYSKLFCLCDSGYTCTYKKSLKAIVTLPMTQSQFLMVQDQFIQAVADAAGVTVDKVTILAVIPQTTPQNRRLLNDKHVQVKVHIKGGKRLHQLEKHLKRKGIPKPSTRTRIQQDHHVHTRLNT